MGLRNKLGNAISKKLSGKMIQQYGQASKSINENFENLKGNATKEAASRLDADFTSLKNLSKNMADYKNSVETDKKNNAAIARVTSKAEVGEVKVKLGAKRDQPEEDPDQNAPLKTNNTISTRLGVTGVQG